MILRYCDNKNDDHNDDNDDDDDDVINGQCTTRFSVPEYSNIFNMLKYRPQINCDDSE
jgi:hypothetical protein